MKLELLKASCTLAVVQWEEKPYDIISDTQKLTKVSSVFTISGDLEGKASVEYLMTYANLNSALYLGLMKIEGVLNGKKGSFIIEDRGVYEAGGCKSTLTIVPGLGTDDLKTISGNGHLVANHTACSFDLNYSL